MSRVLPPPGWYTDPGDETAARWWDGRSWTGQVAPPVGPGAVHPRRRDSLAWIAAAFLAPWCLMGALVGVMGFADTTIQARNWTSANPWHNPIPHQASMLVFVIWILSLNVLLPGLVVGIIAITRQGSHRPARAIALPVLVMAGCVAQFTAPGLQSDYAAPTDFVHGGRLGSLITAAAAVLVAVGSMRLLGLPSRSGRMSVAE